MKERINRAVLDLEKRSKVTQKWLEIEKQMDAWRNICKGKTNEHIEHSVVNAIVESTLESMKLRSELEGKRKIRNQTFRWKRQAIKEMRDKRFWMRTPPTNDI
jgi:hypothetical protein